MLMVNFVDRLQWFFDEITREFQAFSEKMGQIPLFTIFAITSQIRELSFILSFYCKTKIAITVRYEYDIVWPGCFGIRVLQTVNDR